VRRGERAGAQPAERRVGDLLGGREDHESASALVQGGAHRDVEGVVAEGVWLVHHHERGADREREPGVGGEHAEVPAALDAHFEVAQDELVGERRVVGVLAYDLEAGAGLVAARADEVDGGAVDGAEVLDGEQPADGGLGLAA
jgi:hypothetical protein